MNYLFYLGIIVPTLITIVLFLVFIYCWFLQKARREVLTKKYDPHGKMRQMGLSMDPPPPPDYCRMDDSLLPDIGEDNIAYDVSRSPSTEQEGRGRPLYHTYHDSGISAGLSPSQESEPRPGLAYRTCPDSGISGFGPQPTQCSNCCQIQEQRQPHPQQQHQQQLLHQQVYGDQIQIHPQELQQRQYQQQMQHHHLPQAVLHHNLVQASVHPTHGVCYGDDMTHPQSPQHYNHPPLQSANPSLGLGQFPDRQNHLMAQVPESDVQTSLAHNQSKLSMYLATPEHEQYPQHEQMCYHASQILEHQHNNMFLPAYSRQNLDNAVTLTDKDSQPINRGLSTSNSFHPQSSLPGDTNSHQTNTHNTSPSSSSSSTKPLRHSCRDSGVSDIGQPANNGADRPDSQASQSSTTDSEDSGFRSSHCAAHHNARLSKQGNPLLKPLRRTRNTKGKPKTPRTASSNSDDSTANGATPLTTLNPQNLPNHVDNSNVIQNTTLMELDLAHRPPRTPRQSSIPNGNAADNRLPKTSPVTPQAGPALTFHDGSPVHVGSACQHSPTRENWPPQSTNDQESSIKQNIDLNEISTHLSWKYLQDISSSNNPATPSSSMALQSCHSGLRPAQGHQMNPEQHLEMFGYSVV